MISGADDERVSQRDPAPVAVTFRGPRAFVLQGGPARRRSAESTGTGRAGSSPAVSGGGLARSVGSADSDESQAS